MPPNSAACSAARLHFALARQRQSLVLHGGGNTSVKIEKKTSSGNKKVLYVKGSGWDLETIEPPVRAGEAGLRAQAASLTSLSDPQMVNELATHSLRAGAPAPSVETILHAILPQRYVDHTHADAVLSVSNSPDGDKRVRDIYGDKVVVIPYIMAGFDLAAYCAREYPKQKTKNTVGMVLLSHGVFSFAADAKESYELMIESGLDGGEILAAKKAWKRARPRQARRSSARRQPRLRHGVESGRLPSAVPLQRRAAFPRVRPPPPMARISQRRPATPDHVIRNQGADAGTGRSPPLQPIGNT